MASSIQLLRSNNPNERPFPGNLLDGQPAINTNAEEPGLFFKATDGSIVKIGPAAITSDGNPPNTGGTGQSGNTIGELWLDKSQPIPVLKVYDGVQWVDAGSGSGGSPGNVTLQRWVKTASGGETSVSGPDNSAQILSYTPGLEEVFLNGVLLTRGVDYMADSGFSITSLASLTNGDEITVLGWTPFNVLESINGSNLIDGTVSEAKIGTEAITTTKLAVNSVVDSRVSPGAAISSQKLQFVSSDNNAVPRTVQNKLSEFVSVKDFGALTDEEQPGYDSTSAIDAALAFSNAVYFPRGTFNYSGTLSLRGGSRIEGEERSATAINFTSSDQTALYLQQLGVVVKNITIRGGLTGVRVGNETSGGGASGAGRETLMEKVQIINSAGIGIDIQKGWSNYFNEVKIFAPGSHAIRFGTGFINSVKFSGLRVSRMGSPQTVMIQSATLRSVEFEHCIIEGNLNPASVGFYSDPALSTLVGLTLRECYFETHTGAFIDFSGTNNYGVVIEGCDFAGDIPGIISPRGLSILDCTFTGDPPSGNFIANPNSCIILNCAARTSGGSWSTRALISGTTTNCVISNLSDNLPERLGTTFPNFTAAPSSDAPAITLKPTAFIDTSSVETILTATSGTFLVVGQRGSSGSAAFLAHRESNTVSIMTTAGSFAGSLSWSGNELRGTSPGAGGVAWYVTKFG